MTPLYSGINTSWASTSFRTPSCIRAKEFPMTTSWKYCPACERDPDPRGPSACAACRELNTRPDPDLSDAHVDRVAHHLFRTFDDASGGRAPLDFEHWCTLAREAIRIGASL